VAKDLASLKIEVEGIERALRGSRLSDADRQEMEEEWF
jgi:hypothetical protein